MRRLSLPLAIALLTACGDGEGPLVDLPDGGGGSPPDAGTACEPGELALDDGSCRAAGVLPEACAEGFVAAEGGCEPVLPSAPCEPGMMAVVGDTECHEIMPCGAAPWGDIPTAADTQYVDGAYPGGDSDGSAAQPWTTIFEAVAAAAPGAIVAVAAGSYLEDVTLSGAAVRLRGRCPSMVEIVGQTPAYAAVVVLAQGCEIGGIATRGPGGGIAVAALDARLDHLWVHDTENYYGLGAQGDTGPASLTVTDSLIETAHHTGVSAAGGDVTIEGCLIRDPTGGEGVGVRAVPHPSNDIPSTATIRSSLLERNRYFGVYAAGSHLLMEATVVRDTVATPSGVYGVGVQIRDDPASHRLGSGTISGSVLSHNRSAGVIVADGEVVMDSSVIRDTLPDDQTQGFGRAIQVISDLPEGPPASLGLRSSLLEGNRETGLVIIGSHATVETTIIRETLPMESSHMHGRGLAVQIHPDNGRRSSLALLSSVVADNHTSGMAVFASDVVIEDTVVRDTAPRAADQLFGRGITLQADPETGEPAFATIVRSLVERTADVGISIVASDAILEWTVVRDTAARVTDGNFGDGIIVDGAEGQLATLELRSSQVARSTRAGVGNFAGRVLLADSTFGCNAVHLNGEHLDGAFEFLVEGTNTCSCEGETTACKVLSTNLEPPQHLTE